MTNVIEIIPPPHTVPVSQTPVTMTTKRPFIDFYSSIGLTPTRQDVSDMKKHFQRREALHRQLGIPPRLIKNASLVEFGPGSGHNAIFWAVNFRSVGPLFVAKLLVPANERRRRING